MGRYKTLLDEGKEYLLLRVSPEVPAAVLSFIVGLGFTSISLIFFFTYFDGSTGWIESIVIVLVLFIFFVVGLFQIKAAFSSKDFELNCSCVELRTNIFGWVYDRQRLTIGQINAWTGNGIKTNSLCFKDTQKDTVDLYVANQELHERILKKFEYIKKVYG